MRELNVMYLRGYFSLHMQCTCMLDHHAFIQPTDINECELETYPCSPNANCTDTDGSFNCTCNEGFEGNGFNCAGTICIIHKHYYVDTYIYLCLFVCNIKFTDIPECERGLDDCDTNATCTNTFGSYVCTCNTGFTGDGVTCTG